MSGFPPNPDTIGECFKMINVNPRCMFILRRGIPCCWETKIKLMNRNIRNSVKQIDTADNKRDTNYSSQIELLTKDYNSKNCNDNDCNC